MNLLAFDPKQFVKEEDRKCKSGEYHVSNPDLSIEIRPMELIDQIIISGYCVKCGESLHAGRGISLLDKRKGLQKQRKYEAEQMYYYAFQSKGG